MRAFPAALSPALRPALRPVLALPAAGVLLLLAACGQGTGVDADPAGASSTTAAAAATSTSSTSASAAATTPTAGTTASATPDGGATGTGLSSSVVITAPTEGEVLPAGQVGVVGRGTASEGTLLWRITEADGTVLSDGYTTAGANGEVGDFAVQQQVQAGTCEPCTVQVWAPDESGGEGSLAEGPATVTFTVR